MFHKQLKDFLYLILDNLDKRTDKKHILKTARNGVVVWMYIKKFFMLFGFRDKQILIWCLQTSENSYVSLKVFSTAFQSRLLFQITKAHMAVGIPV